MQSHFKLRRGGILAVMLIGLAIAMPDAARACPFCSPALTFSDRIKESHASYAVRWIAGNAGDAKSGIPAFTRYEIVAVFKNPDSPRRIGEIIDVNEFHPGTSRQGFLLVGNLREGEVIAWDTPLPASQEVLAYLLSRPPRTVDRAERLAWHLDYLEHPQEDIAVDAYSEFANSPYEAVLAIRERLPRDKLHRWVAKTDFTSGRVARVGFYGMVLGLCGDADDARMLERVIQAPGGEFRIGIDGIMAGYLMLSGTRGLELLEQHAFAPGMPSSEAFALHQALRFMWDFSPHTIERERLRASLRKLLDDPQFTELAITDLTRWEDLSLVDRLIRLYAEEAHQVRSTQTAIIRYYLDMSALNVDGRKPAEQQAIERAKLHLQQLRQVDPELVTRAETRFLPG